LPFGSAFQVFFFFFFLYWSRLMLYWEVVEEDVRMLAWEFVPLNVCKMHLPDEGTA